MWIKNGDRKHENYNYKVMTFRSSIIERITMKAPLYGIEVKYVNPKGNNKLNKTRRNHEEIRTRQTRNISLLNSSKRLKHQ